MLNSIYKKFFNKTSYNLQDLLDKIESISELIRHDLGVENLNIKLKKRLKVEF